ncbi:MAG: hypothetical protein WD872_06780 [Pirellulaceae bacterium]
MRFLLGMDEAGYGPNLGPLVIAATAWQIPRVLETEALYEALAEVVCCHASHAGDERLAIADSKQLYKPGGSLAALERSVLAALAWLARLPTAWRELWPQIDSQHGDAWHALAWHQGYDEAVPIHVPAGELARLAPMLAQGCRQRGVQLIDLQAAVLVPRQFNELVERCGNKAEVLSLTTLALARRMIERLPSPEPVQVVCDRHGGRARYAALLQHVFPESLVAVRQETAELGVYELRCDGRPAEFRFLVKGERMLPTALASMTAKYLRELAMRPFNAFWKGHVPGLRATAGYPSDAHRFRAEIQAMQRKLNIADRDLWRDR